ncbi:putative GAMM1 protein [Toxoplasma gondii VAND]|uniref:Putative GAMM1 protein n=2 Tax=Toxoplasma gondii TaxID=5811 RepID=A0A2G8Y0I8_TOXGO|nr:putative GAMM1 protein [Toxoplasma gondii VAND]PIM00795.1 putative GAMM1 protein [Toxoplasma gondii COUG]
MNRCATHRQPTRFPLCSGASGVDRAYSLGQSVRHYHMPLATNYRVQVSPFFGRGGCRASFLSASAVQQNITESCRRSSRPARIGLRGWCLFLLFRNLFLSNPWNISLSRGSLSRVLPTAGPGASSTWALPSFSRFSPYPAFCFPLCNFTNSQSSAIPRKQSFSYVSRFAQFQAAPDEPRFRPAKMTTAEAPRRPVIGTHSGKFHEDEVLATVMLLSLPEFQNARVVRSRDPAVLATCDIVVDVGAEYDPEKRRFDHHQKSFTLTFYGESPTASDTLDSGNKDAGKDDGGQVSSERRRDAAGNGKVEEKACKKAAVTKLSSAGLIYKHFGKDILRHRFGLTSPELLDCVFERLYTSFVEAVDAIDNGVSIASNGSPLLYKDSTNLSSRVSRCYPPWNLEELRATRPQVKRLRTAEADLYPAEVEGGSVEEVHGFRKAMKLVDAEFEDAVSSIVDVWLPARQVVLDAVQERTKVHSSGRIVKLKQWCPFQEHLHEIEAELQLDYPILFCLYPDLKNGTIEGWRVYAVNEKDQLFKSRLPLLEKLRGLRDSELGKAVLTDERTQKSEDMSDSDFIHCHATGFIGGTKTLSAAMAMATLTMKDAGLC